MGKARKKHLAARKTAQTSKEAPLSAALIAMIESLRYEDMSIDELRGLISFAASAWNLALLPKAERGPMLMDMMKKMPEMGFTLDEILFAGSSDEVTAEPSRAMNFAEVIKSMMHIKDKWYPNDRRPIVDWEVALEGGEYRVRVYSEQPSSAEPESRP